MSQTITHARIALERPERSAGNEGDAVLRLWSDWKEQQAALASFQPQHSIRSHPVTATAAKALERLPADRVTRVRCALEDFLEAIHSKDVSHAPELELSCPDDGSVLLEWTFKDRRFGMSFEESEGESGWYFVFSREPSTRYEAGTMDQLDMERMTRLTLKG